MIKQETERYGIWKERNQYTILARSAIASSRLSSPTFGTLRLLASPKQPLNRNGRDQRECVEAANPEKMTLEIALRMQMGSEISI